MRVDALVFSADCISYNWQVLRTMGAFADELDEASNNRRRTAMMGAAWSIVDELDAVRQIVHSFNVPGEPSGPLTTALITACEPVRALRNKMRHLTGNLKNRANSSGEQSPLFGCLSWVACPDRASGKAHIMVLQAGMLYGREKMKMANPAGRTFVSPADLFQLDAFGTCLELATPINARGCRQSHAQIE